MSSSPNRPDLDDPAVTIDGFDVLDLCHRRILYALGKLAALVARLGRCGADDEARSLAAEVHAFFSTTVRQHHEDEERHVLPQMLASGDARLEHAAMRLRQDHRWLEEDWMELSPQLEAVAAGQSTYDLDTLRQGVNLYAALLHDHIALEEACAYPQARERMRAADRREMGREMAARRRRKSAETAQDSTRT